MTPRPAARRAVVAVKQCIGRLDRYQVGHLYPAALGGGATAVAATVAAVEWVLRHALE
jgi:hypothetical protein